MHISELAIAVAMMELESDGRKKARKLVHKGLIVPTENALAQIFWAKENRHLNDGFGLDALVKSAVDAYEADYRVALINGDVCSALHSAQTWHDDEPFAARPCVEIAYAASILDDHELTIRMARDVKKLDGRRDPGLELNAIFSKLSSGNLNPAKDKVEINRLRARIETAITNGDGNSYHAVANLGLWEYRYGDISVGREYYQQAIADAQKLHFSEAAAWAAIFAAREAILSGDASADAILLQAKDLAHKTKNKPSEFYLRKLDALVEHPADRDEILSPASASRFIEKTKEKVPGFRVEKGADGLILWVQKKR